MPEPKYVLCPGKVQSRADGQVHYIGAHKLAMLYGVAVNECIVYEPAPWWPESYYRMAEESHRGLTHLRPQYSGNYSLDPA